MIAFCCHVLVFKFASEIQVSNISSLCLIGMLRNHESYPLRYGKFSKAEKIWEKKVNFGCIF